MNRTALFLFFTAQCLVLCCVLPLSAQQRAAQSVRVTGEVLDASGAPVSGAQVELRARHFFASTATSAAGEFSFDNVSAASGTILVHARGFGEVPLTWSATDGKPVRLAITLRPVGLVQNVTVTARTPTPLVESPTSNQELTHQDLQDSPNVTLDDTLRQIPGFSLFRRSGSRTANPTAQGVSLRGLGANGSSRALVLEDGIPINDPFGGWIYWDRIPEQSVQSIEVSQEGGSSLYGSDALGGVLEFFTRSPEEEGISLETSYGNQDTPDLSLWAGGAWHGWESSFAGEVFHTDGYVLIPEAYRGTVDTKAGSAHGTADLRIGRKFGNGSDVFARGWFLDESRANGTPDQVNNTRMGEGALGADLQLGKFGALTLRFYGDAQTYNQTFSSVAVDRDSETLTDIQAVPAQGVGGSAVWSRAVGKRQTLVAGLDTQEVMGRSNEQLVLAGKETSSGGRQRTSGIFGEDIIQITPRWTLSASVRFDHWSNFDASLITIPFGSSVAATIAPYANRSYNAFSPRLTLVHQVNARVSWSASIYRAFRAPTLNELYRAFRVGDVVTDANSNLSAERLTGGEAGVSVDVVPRRLTLRGTGFFNEIVDPVANITLSTTPTLITRQRQNLGRTTAPGAEIDASTSITSHLSLTAGYQYVDATVSSFPVNRALVGLWVAQVPHHVITFQARYDDPARISFSIAGRMVGQQFDDDQNQFPMGRFFVLDGMVSRSISHGAEVFVSAENLFNAQYFTAATPVPQLGLPIAVRAGVRFDWSRR
ncbi:MAG TPA: TonB-dependent receptor [Candidatus Acidoferrales bacterium]|nr:TonB-dependent receptor [Candidatus Acidoferrales bacterium]